MLPFHAEIVFCHGFDFLFKSFRSHCGVGLFLRHFCVGSSNSHSVSWQADVDSVQSIVGRHQREKFKKKVGIDRFTP